MAAGARIQWSLYLKKMASASSPRLSRFLPLLQDMPGIPSLSQSLRERSNAVIASRKKRDSNPAARPRAASFESWVRIRAVQYRYGGRSGIRTHEELTPLPVFKTGALNRSAILPFARAYSKRILRSRARLQGILPNLRLAAAAARSLRASTAIRRGGDYVECFDVIACYKANCLLFITLFAI